MKIIKWLVLGIGLALANPTWSLTIVSSFPQVGTMSDLPRNFSKVPSGFGSSLVDDGDYLIPDANQGIVWRLPQGGGSLSAFAQFPQPTQSCPWGWRFMQNGTFLPLSFGDYGGQFIMGGLDVCDAQYSNWLDGNSFLQAGALWAIDADGNIQNLPVNHSFPSYLGDANWNPTITPIIAPSGFGSFGGKLFVSASQDSSTYIIPGSSPHQLRTTTLNNIFRVDESLNVSVFYSRRTDFDRNFIPPIPPVPPVPSWWDIIFAPSSFGSVGGTMLVTETERDSNNVAIIGRIQSIDSSGTLKLFTEFPLEQTAGFVAQMGFAPISFAPYGGKLFVSIAGKSGGGGINGALLVFDSAGNRIAEIIKGDQTNHFDPRGFYFTDQGTMLIADASTEVLQATPQDFVRTAFPFSTFNVTQLLIDKKHDALFLLSNFTLAKDSNGVNPLTEVVTAQIGNVTLTIPANSFRKIGKLPYSFVGFINNVWIEALITPLGGNRFGFQIATDGADLSGIKNPVTVAISIGDDVARASVKAIIK